MCNDVDSSPLSMKSPYVKEIEAGQTVNTNFMVLSKDVRQKKSGDPFLSLILSDKTQQPRQAAAVAQAASGAPS